MDTNETILERLEEWQQKEGSLPKILEFYRDLLRIQTEARGRIAPPQPTLGKDSARARTRKGVPLLEWDALGVEWEALEGIFQAVAAAIGEHTSSATGGLNDVASDRASLQEAMRVWYEGGDLAALAHRYHLDEEVLSAALHCAVKPFLSAQAEALIGLVPQEQWRNGYCPVCGGKPDFAYLDEERGARWLLCSRCDSEWLFQRLECPYCASKEQEKLKYFADEGGLYRLYVCDRCRSYLKAIDLRRAQSPVLLPLERVLTVDIDRQGQEQGYKAGCGGTSSDDKR